ncbi:MAG: hypothetical protein Q9180_005362, partial [Flavoplaca navasiana]
MASTRSHKSPLSGESISDEIADEALTTVDKAAEKVVLRKLDWHILPLITLIYTLAFLD